MCLYPCIVEDNLVRRMLQTEDVRKDGRYTFTIKKSRKLLKKKGKEVDLKNGNSIFKIF